MATEVLTWPGPPTLTDASDSTTYVMGVQFSVTEAVPCSAIEWRVPDTLITPPAGFHAVLWEISPNVKVRDVSITPVAGTTQRFAIPTFSLVPGTEYIAAVMTNRYTFRSGVGVFPVSSPSGKLIGSTGKLTETVDPDVVPGSSFASIYYVTPVIGADDVPATPVSTTLTGKWSVSSRVSSTLTGRWAVWSRITSLFTSRWSVEGSVDPDPDPVTVSTYLMAQRSVTLAFIADDPTVITLVPHARVKTPTGGFIESAGTPRAEQTVKTVLLSNDQRPVITVAGVERSIDYHLVGRWDMEIAVGDLWEAPDGTRWEVLGFTEGWDYMTKAFLGRHVPRTGKP